MKTSSKRVKETPGEDSERVKQTHGMVIFLVVVTCVLLAVVIYQLARLSLINALT
jgi:hypothetical protein